MKVTKIEKQFGKAISKRRKTMKLTQLQVAKKSKLKRAHYATMEIGGQSVLLRHAATICKVLGLKLEKSIR